MFNLLLKELEELNTRLKQRGITMILAGGMGLFLRDSFLGGHRSPRYPIRPESRTTEDLDVLLTADVIVDAHQMEQLRDVLDEMGYESEVRYFQFKRSVDSDQDGRTVKVDLLAAPPDDEEDVKINPPRIRPREASDIHAYLTDEAAGIDTATIPIDLGAHTDEVSGPGATVEIPSSINYLILKLHAFHDRKDQTDSASDEGRHHAFDIFRIVTDMRETDWETAQQHVRRDRDHEYLKDAARFQRNYFAEENDIGVLRLKENQAYRREKQTFDGYLSEFLEDMNELFVDVETK